MKKYNVSIPVYDTIKVSVECSEDLTNEEIIQLALIKAIEEKPLVTWQHDTDSETIIQEDD